jgi:hypothetical protein
MRQAYEAMGDTHAVSAFPIRYLLPICNYAAGNAGLS